jgi:hypothetical protein
MIGCLLLSKLYIWIYFSIFAFILILSERINCFIYKLIYYLIIYYNVGYYYNFNYSINISIEK